MSLCPLRSEYKQHQDYSNRESLPVLGSVSPVLPKDKMIHIYISRRWQGHQYLVFVYLRSIEIVKIGH